MVAVVVVAADLPVSFPLGVIFLSLAHNPESLHRLVPSRYYVHMCYHCCAFVAVAIFPHLVSSWFIDKYGRALH